MNPRFTTQNRPGARRAERGSVLVIVLLIAFGLVSMALYFANSMSLELRAADNRTSGLASDQIVEGAARYIGSVLTQFATNGAVPDLDLYETEAVAIGNSRVTDDNGRFWLIGRDPAGNTTADPYFALVDEASKLNLNASWLTSDIISSNLPRMTFDLADAIIDWRDTNGSGASLNYSQLGYLPKHAAFESVGELRLVFGATRDILTGPDLNQNGVLDANEERNGLADPGLFDYFTVYTREPNTYSDGTALTNVNQQAGIQSLLELRLGGSRAQAIMRTLGFTSTNNNNAAATPPAFSSLLQFYLRSGITADEFGQIYGDVTATNATFTVGRVNINTATATVLACLPGLDANYAQQLVDYRNSNPANLTSIAWVATALGANNPVLQTLAQGDFITTHSYQFSADIAAVGPFGRGYRRVRFVFDLSEGTPKIIYRQDLSRLGWALGRQTRDTWIAKNTR